eukprot:CAMPEP_0182799514 /NCGR_PEP_ID=MMETSP0006_2-20121128/1926_1 /TAXON_ID=97485 /ORGANISM="Prymnesium parvum, Strain Texoma1" /LENGTH=122 /DNA_ID=CAMNT_0024924707 /DNA_START=471 /DNA_END=839 /DNA_ORIENTATION=+
MYSIFQPSLDKHHVPPHACRCTSGPLRTWILHHFYPNDRPPQLRFRSGRSRPIEERSLRQLLDLRHRLEQLQFFQQRFSSVLALGSSRKHLKARNHNANLNDATSLTRKQAILGSSHSNLYA